MKKCLMFIILLSLQLTLSEAKEPKAYELPRTQVVPIQDSELGREYELYIRLPEAYSSNSDKKHPVIYYTDAVWHIETLSAMADFLAQDSILVGISWQTNISEERKNELGAHASRFRDYRMRESSDPTTQAKMQFGQANKHLSFIRNDVIPYIESNYRTVPENRSYFGYSLGGQFGAYILLRQANTFKNYILGAPAFGDNYGPFLSELESNSASSRKGFNANVYIAYGNTDNRLAELGEPLVTLLSEKQDASLNFTSEELEGNHLTAFPITAVRSMTWLSELLKPES
ncbi:alpha/beta hydrolase [Pelagicoccus mobilis]|uniref:Alpha/beta hydrolase n=1 Tax=Pelagicoccus mobilis TaxID=415221 RepID=A0A934VTE8_9BACT|nr:alpha/beta hydrolase-fold protein [Pelagicoccus mobilis]MBK1879454.1 alpha/beta hydrolase [Pelagicoccus mobilis]